MPNPDFRRSLFGRNATRTTPTRLACRHPHRQGRHQLSLLRASPGTISIFITSRQTEPRSCGAFFAGGPRPASPASPGFLFLRGNSLPPGSLVQRALHPSALLTFGRPRSIRGRLFLRRDDASETRARCCPTPVGFSDRRGGAAATACVTRLRRVARVRQFDLVETIPNRTEL